MSDHEDTEVNPPTDENQLNITTHEDELADETNDDSGGAEAAQINLNELLQQFNKQQENTLARWNKTRTH
jgi:hypothetical protein